MKIEWKQCLRSILRPDRLGRGAIKESFDDLPSAACYFTEEGLVKLCNFQMFRLYRILSGRDLQTLDELHETLRHPLNVTAVGEMGNTWLFPDGRCWLYAENTVSGCDGARYTEAIFSDVTELYERRQELLAQTEQLRTMRREIKDLSDNVLEMTREKEILSFKIRLHDQMGYGLAAVRQCLLQEQPPAETDLALRQLEKAVQLFDRDNAAPAGENEWEEFVRDAEAIGVTVALTGELPPSPGRQDLLLTAARECFSNAVRHADADRLEVSIRETDTETVWQFTNNGRVPEADSITPGGGLNAMESRVRQAGGTLRLDARPRYRLTITLPKEEVL